MDEDAIEYQHQIHMQYYARIRFISSEYRQKLSPVKYKYTNCNIAIKNAITMVNNETRYKFKDTHESTKI